MPQPFDFGAPHRILSLFPVGHRKKIFSFSSLIYLSNTPLVSSLYEFLSSRVFSFFPRCRSVASCCALNLPCLVPREDRIGAPSFLFSTVRGRMVKITFPTLLFKPKGRAGGVEALLFHATKLSLPPFKEKEVSPSLSQTEKM